MEKIELFFAYKCGCCFMGIFENSSRRLVENCNGELSYYHPECWDQTCKSYGTTWHTLIKSID